ncbi:hypothetical protein CJ231_08815 [Hoylesella buccalis]|jgi:hypothetical protein|uniref:Uncharacterized protein n=1 Tax=Hoylesella buccalis TaxID=28127 RepID=A0A2N6QPP6_9BACT|nr:hypothetical protein [Hoylesella buccalis]PMC23635.1 hypothetical protein CJ231_08815 [Hoylesella buccalis]
MKHIDLQHRSTEQLSRWVLYALSALTVCLFALYYLVGYNQPYVENPDFNEPLLTTTLIIFMYTLLITTVGIGVWSIVRETKRRRSESKVNNGIPTALISRCVAGGTLMVFALTFALGSTQPLMTNGKSFTDSMLLRMADLFINTSILLLVAAALAAVYGMTRYYRKQKREHAD